MNTKTLSWSLGGIAAIVVAAIGYHIANRPGTQKIGGPGSYEMSVSRGQACDHTRQLGRTIHNSKAAGIPMESIISTISTDGSETVNGGFRRIVSEIYGKSLSSAEAEGLAWAICMDSLTSSGR